MADPEKRTTLISDEELEQRVNALSGTPQKTDAELAADFERIFEKPLPFSPLETAGLTETERLMAEMQDVVAVEASIKADEKAADKKFASRVSALRDYTKLSMPQLKTLEKELKTHTQRLRDAQKIMSTKEGLQGMKEQLTDAQERLASVQEAIKNKPAEVKKAPAEKPARPQTAAARVQKESTAPKTNAQTTPTATKNQENAAPKTPKLNTDTQERIKKLEAVTARVSAVFDSPAYQEQLEATKEALATPDQQSTKMLERLEKVMAHHEALVEKTAALAENIEQLIQEAVPEIIINHNDSETQDNTAKHAVEESHQDLQVANQALKQSVKPLEKPIEKTAAPTRGTIQYNPKPQPFPDTSKPPFNIVDYMKKMEQQMKTARTVAEASIKTSPGLTQKVLGVALTLKSFIQAAKVAFNHPDVKQQSQMGHKLA